MLRQFIRKKPICRLAPDLLRGLYQAGALFDCVGQRAFHVDVPARLERGDLPRSEYVAEDAGAAVEDDPVLSRSANHDRICRGTGARDEELTIVDAIH